MKSIVDMVVHARIESSSTRKEDRAFRSTHTGVVTMNHFFNFLATGARPIRSVLLVAGCLVSATCGAGMLAKDGTIRFFSKTAMMDIEGVTKTAVSTLNLDSGTIAIKSRNTTYAFPDKLMQVHFNENYMESEKFPVSAFTGTFSGMDRAAFAAGKKVAVVVDGSLDVHGVSKHYRTSGVLQKAADGSINGDTKFHVRILDHGINIPRAVAANFCDSMEITARFTWRPADGSK